MKTTEHEKQLATLTTWLTQISRDRAWLADAIGVSIGAVNGWYSIATKREIPGPTWKLITLIMRNTALGEPLFTYDEALRVSQAMKVAGYAAFSEFARDAVKVKTEKELEEHSQLAPIPLFPKVADDSAKYGESAAGNGGTG